MSQFEIVKFQVRECLKAMTVNSEYRLSARTCKYTTLKATAAQLKKLGFGCWKVHKLSGTETLIIRES